MAFVNQLRRGGVAETLKRRCRLCVRLQSLRAKPRPLLPTAGLLVVSTRVGGVPEVLPSDILLLAEPSCDGILEVMPWAPGWSAVTLPWIQRGRAANSSSSALPPCIDHSNPPSVNRAGTGNRPGHPAHH